MRYTTIPALVFILTCGTFVLARGGGAPRAMPHPQYRMGHAPRPQFKIGGRAFPIKPDARNTKQVRAMKPEEFDPTTRSHRVDDFYRKQLKDHYADLHKHPRHDYGPFRSEFIELARHWPARERAHWAWHNREYLDDALWAEWMADPAFADEVATLEHGKVEREAGFLPSEYASIPPVAIYNDEYLNAAYNPTPFLVVMKLKSLKPDERTDWIGTATADSLTSRLSSVPGMFVADREQVASVLRDKKLVEVSTSEADAAAQLGKALDVEQVVTGSYVADGDKVLFNLRIVNVQTGAVQTGISYTVTRDRLLDEMPTLGTSLATTLGFEPQIETVAAAGSTQRSTEPPAYSAAATSLSVDDDAFDVERYLAARKVAESRLSDNAKKVDERKPTSGN
jgi:TolB-like protein